MAINKNENHAGYLKYLRENKPEQDILYQDLLIPVTDFFRDPTTFDNLCKTVLTVIVENKPGIEPIRVWVAGCSTGEEVYSIAICFNELLSGPSEGSEYRPAPYQKIQIFATDISEPAIAKARAGIYSKSDIKGLSSQQLQVFFTKTNGSYQANKSIRDMCVFAVHNFLKDPPFSKIDFISCRNVLIYMEPYLQKRALTTFHYALNPKAFLLLGKSETTAGVPELFAAIDKKDKIFTRKDVPGSFINATSQRREESFADMTVKAKRENSRTDFQKTADDIMLSKYTPAGVVINETMDIVHFRGSTGNYLEPSPGKASLNLLRMAKEGLAFELRNILHKARKEHETILKENIPVLINNSLRNISIEAIPLPNMAEPHYLILFHETVPASGAKQPIPKVAAKRKNDDKDLRIKQLELELAQVREDMRSITEDQETVNEELQSANEELLSGSEELQSLNEEMETSKEELQSTNEELTVVNQEMIGLNEQITEARDYAEAIVATVHEPLLVLNKNLRIKSANDSFYKTFQVNERDTEDKLIYELGNKQWNIPTLRALLEDILPHKTKFQNFEVTHSFPNIGERIMLLNAREMTRDKEDEKLILLAIEDITEETRFKHKESELLNRFQNLVTQAPVAILVLKGKDYVVEIANDFYLQIVEQENHFIGELFFDSLPNLRTQGVKELFDKVMQTGNPFYGNEMEFQILRNDKREQCFFNFIYQPIKGPDNTVTGIIVVVNEVTEQVIARKKMEAQAKMVENMLMTAPGFVCILEGPDHIYGLVNEQYQQLFGKRKIQGKPILVALPELEGQGFDKLLDKVYYTGEPYVGIDIPITLSRDEDSPPELRYFNFSYQPMYDENHTIYSILVFGYEVTAQMVAKIKIQESQQKHAKELEQNVLLRTLELNVSNELLQEKNEDLIKMNKELESFTYVSSHDLQEPLRKIQTFSNRILEKEYLTLSDKGKDYFKRMQSAAARMQQLIEDLLSFSRLNTAERTFENNDLTTIIEEVKTEFKEVIEEKHAIFEATELCRANIIPFQFRQLMHNIISNALKFSKTGIPPHIIIKGKIEKGSDLNTTKSLMQTGRIAPEKNYCHISITDNGIGFDAQYKDQIFEVFQRLHGKEEYSGTGIGLSIVKKIVENHNGIIIATSEPDKGATFDIYIPAR